MASVTQLRRPADSPITSGDALVLEHVTRTFGALRLNHHTGNPAPGGDDAVVLGDIAAAGADCEGTVYVPKRFAATGPDALVAVTDRDGNLWVFMGADSGFEGRTTWYIMHIRVAVRRL